MADNVVIAISFVGWVAGIVALCFGWQLMAGLVFSVITFGLMAALKFGE